MTNHKNQFDITLMKITNISIGKRGIQFSISLRIVNIYCGGFFVFDLILYGQVNNFSFILGWVFLDGTSPKQGLMCLAQGQNVTQRHR